jgi:glycosyltransferase involved in cell wall biosynthesis
LQHLVKMDKSKKILVIAGGSYISGAEKVTLDVIAALKEEGYQLHCLVNGWNDGEFIGQLQILNVPFTSCKLGWYYMSRLLWSLDSLVHYPMAIARFFFLYRWFNPDIVYTVSYRQIVLLYPFFRKNIIFHVHDPYSETRQSRFFVRLISRKVKMFIAVSDFIKRDLICCGIPQSKIEVVHNGVEVTDTKWLQHNSGYMPKKKLRIGIVGQVIPRKGHEDLVAALDLIHGRINFECLIFGKGDKAYTDVLKNQITACGLDNSVKWMGFIKNKEEVYNQIDVVVAPTRNEEPFALVVLEAGAFCRASVVSDSGGFPESIIDGETGFVIPKKSPGILAEKLTALFSNPVLLVRMGENANKNIRENFTLQKMKKTLTGLFAKF